MSTQKRGRCFLAAVPDPINIYTQQRRVAPRDGLDKAMCQFISRRLLRLTSTTTPDEGTIAGGGVGSWKRRRPPARRPKNALGI